MAFGTFHLVLCLTSFSTLFQVQSIVNIANGTFSLLDQLSPTLRAVSRTLAGMAHTFDKAEFCHCLLCLCAVVKRNTTAGLGESVPLLSSVTSLTDQANNLNNTASSVDSLVASGTNAVAQIQKKGIGVSLCISMYLA